MIGARCSRRALLHALGAGFAAAPFAGSSSRAAPGTGLTRFVGVYMPHGVARELWRPRAGFDVAYPDASLSPFDDAARFGVSLRDRLLVVEGLDLRAGIDGGTAGHDGARVVLTGSAADGANPSLDQLLAIEGGLGASTPLASLVLGVGHRGNAIGGCISYARGGIALPKIVDPSQTFHEAFGRWLAAGDPSALARAEVERRRGRSALDALRADLAALARRAGGAERSKLEQHATALRELEKRLAGFELACAAPPAPDPAGFPRLLAGAGGEPYFDVIAELQIDLLCQALACGVTRVATLFLADLGYGGLDPELPADVHGEVAHRYAAATDDAFTSGGDPETWRRLARQNRHSYGLVARLAARLAELGLLDTTLVLATSDLGDPARHSSRSVPTVLATGAASLRPGRYLDARRDGAGVPNNRLLVSVARTFGVEVTSFGEADDPATTEGELPGLL